MHNQRVPLLGSQNDVYSMERVNHRIGERTYELSNHLGNVLSVVSDKLMPVDYEASRTIALFDDQFDTPGDVRGWGHNYYPYDSGFPLLPSSSYELTSVGGGLRLKTGWDGIDNIYKAANYIADPWTIYTLTFDITQLDEPGTHLEMFLDGTSQVWFLDHVGSYTYSYYLGDPSTWENPYLGGILISNWSCDSVTFDNMKLTYESQPYAFFRADIRQSTDYSPFGVILENRNLVLTGAEKSRYGFNGEEKDDELKGAGNSYDFGARMLDPRVGRWLSLDPLAIVYPSLSPYNFVSNSPMIFIDPDGEKIKFAKSLDPEIKRAYRSQIRYLKHNSPTFKAIYRDLKRSENVYTLNKTDQLDGDKYDVETREIRINFKGNSQDIKTHLVIAHELGHTWRDMMDLDIKEEDSPYCYDSPTTEGTIEHQVFMIKKSFSMEFEGLHIENVIRAELGEPLRDIYDVKTDFTVKDQDPNSENPRFDFNKKILAQVIITKDGNYDYKEEANHYEELFKRKWDVKEIDVTKYDEDKYTKSNH